MSEPQIAVIWGDPTVSAPSKCRYCLANDRAVTLRHGRMVHSRGLAYMACADWDTECRHLDEPLGFYRFAWWPRRCRNGRWRWLCWVEHHLDGTYSLGNRAH